MAVNLKIVSQVVTSGTPGPVGKSAYQIAVDNGFEGTESEWLKSGLFPFKGWYDSVSELESEHANPTVGEYAYVKGATSSDPVKIYECSTEGTWSDSGRTVDTSTVQTFGSGEAVNDVGIDNEPTAESNNLVKSGGVLTGISNQSNTQKVVGNNNNFTATAFRGLIPSHKYRIYVKNTSPSVDNVSDTILYIYKGTVGNYTLVHQVVKTQLPLNSYYDVEIPDSIEPNYQIIINTKSDSGYLQYFTIEDITNIESLNTKLINADTDLATRDNTLKVIGNGNTFTYCDFRGIIPSRKYRVFIKNTNPAVSEISQGNVVLIISIGYQGNYEQKVSVIKGGTISSFYDIETPSVIADNYRIAINTRSNVGCEQYFTIEDITDTSNIESDIKGVSENYVEDTSLIKNKAISGTSINNSTDGRLLIIPTDNNSSFLIQDDGVHGWIFQWGFLESVTSTTLLNSAQTWLSDGTLHSVDIPQGAGAVAITLISSSGINPHVGYVGFPLIGSTGDKISQLQTDVAELQRSLDKKKFVSNININDIFETNMIQNEFFESSTGWTLSNATISNNKLNLSGASWGYQTLTLQENHKYLIVCYAKLSSNNNRLNNERYVYLDANGIGFTGANEGATLISRCCGFLPIIGIYDSNVTSKSFSFGILRQHQDTQETGEISHAGVYDITEFSDITYNEFYYAYKNYIEGKLVVERLDDKIVYPDTLAKKTFMDEMNSFAKEYGMSNTVFYNPSGVHISNTSVGGNNNISTSADLCKMCASLLYNPKALRIGNIRCSSEVPFVVNILGKNSRTISITSSVGSLAMESALGGRFVFGGKGGSWNSMPGMSGTATNYVILVKDKETDKNIVVSFMKFDNVGGQSNAAQLKIIIDAVLAGETTLSDYAPAYAAGGLVPSGDPSAFKNLEFLTLSKDKNTQYEPFSTTKLMTFIVACEYGNMSDLITIYASDFQGGSGTQMQDGDILTLRDALAVMMMESNNTIATAVSRFIGQKILQLKYK